MSQKYTVEIIKQGAAGLDGTTLLDTSAPGVSVNKSRVGLVAVTVPDGVALGAIDPGQLVGRPTRGIKVNSFAIASDGGAPVAGDVLNRIGPESPGGNPGQEVQLADLNTDVGLAQDVGTFQFRDRLGILSAQAGPHRIVIAMEEA